MSGPDPLERLSRLCGIAGEYTDIWGHVHEVGSASRAGLLAAMGVATDSPQAVERALEARERGQRLLPPVQVHWADRGPIEIALSVAAGAAQTPLRWTLREEQGRELQGEIVPAALPGLEETQGEGGHRRVLLRLAQVPGPGYHRLSITPAAGGDGPTGEMSLIVAPSTCYQPPPLADSARVWGPAVQLYALRSQRNWGIGDFTDLRLLIDTASALGAGVVGVNPLHALFPQQPRHASPYSPSSRLFVNVLYLDVEAIADYAECEAARAAVQDPRFQARLRALRGTDLVDYPAVAEMKLSVLQLLYRNFRHRHLEGDRERGRAFRAFQREQGRSLRLHALFETLQEHFLREDPDLWGWPAWPEAYRDPGAAAVAEFAGAHLERVEFYEYLQWLAQLQLGEVGARSLELGLVVGLYQDLAVSVDRAGAEAWANQALYALDARIGSPPDDFNLNGQDWGLPPLIPERLYQAAYRPFIATLRSNMRHGGALRIDHVMGLMRLFWVPRGADAGRRRLCSLPAAGPARHPGAGEPP